MAVQTKTSDRLTDFERAICYHTLPEITHPVTLGLLLAYAVVLLEAVILLVAGAVNDNISWTTAGLIAVAAAVILGIIAFTARATLNEVRKRKVLATATGVPDPRLSDHDLTPDPFGHHLLLRRLRNPRSRSFTCTDRDGNVQYLVEHPDRQTWHVRRADDTPWLTLHTARRAMSFTFEQRRTPGKLNVLENGEQVAQIQLRYSLTKPTFTVQCGTDDQPRFRIRRRGIYQDERLVGRVYYLRQYLYLDVKESAFHPALLAYFVAME
jgi:hypothetical protein